uniref:tyrosine-protein phosphatase n=1 Tax=Collimonas silvisoli TaxID=2825884 RepID=UPI001B8C6070|nr:tyrosine-protein phosphatase [Collimonas silvisoli]
MVLAVVGVFTSSCDCFLKLAEQNKSMLYHCTAGKDRTGFASAPLRSALSIDRATVIANYLKSHRHTKKPPISSMAFACNHGFNA